MTDTFDIRILFCLLEIFENHTHRWLWGNLSLYLGHFLMVSVSLITLYNYPSCLCLITLYQNENLSPSLVTSAVTCLTYQPSFNLASVNIAQKVRVPVFSIVVVLFLQWKPLLTFIFGFVTDF